MNRHLYLVAAASLVLGLPSLAHARISAAQVERSDAGTLDIRWSADHPVDVYESGSPQAAIGKAKLLARADDDGHYSLPVTDRARHYFLLVDGKDRQQVEVAEREVRLEQSSNFRDLGGYSAAGGKHVRWGLIYRSGGQPLLTPADVEAVRALGIAQLIDLRSSEERVMAPTRITGVPYTAVGYSMADLLRAAGIGTGAQVRNGADIYRNFPEMLAPQIRLVFDALLNKQQPIVYNCSAGQDRTGFVSAVVLTALGVDRDTVTADYLLSTKLRRPQFEMPQLDPAVWGKDPAGQMFLKMQQSAEWKTPQPLQDAQGPFLRGAFAAIDEKWGSVDGYLQKEIGLTAVDLATLKRVYLQ